VANADRWEGAEVPMIVAIANQKGGVAKSTTSLALSVVLGDMGYRVLVIDSDPQANLSLAFGLLEHDIKANMYQIYAEELSIAEATIKDLAPNVDLVPSHIDLAQAEIELTARFAGETVLRRALEPVVDKYDWIMLDCPPSLGMLTFNVLTACDTVLVPVSAQPFAIQGLTRLLQTVDMAKEVTNPKCHVGGIVLTMYDQRRRVEQDLYQLLKENFEASLETVIPNDVRLMEPGYHNQPLAILEESRGTLAYTELAKELIQKWHVPRPAAKPLERS